MAQSTAVHGEILTVTERVIIAPAQGRFRPLAEVQRPGDEAPGPGLSAMEEHTMATGEQVVGEQLAVEQVIGFIDGAGQSTPVRSAFSGLLMGLLAHAGERVREGQPVAWLRLEAC